MASKKNTLKILFSIFIVVYYNFFLFESQAIAVEFFNGFEQSTPDLYIGENDGLYLRPQGFYINIFTNDSICYNPINKQFCGTDKYLSNSSGGGFHLGSEIEKEFYQSFAASLNWRAITPAEQPYYGAPNFKQPIGIYSDWIELSIAYALTWITTLGGWKAKIGGSIGDVDNHGMKSIQRYVHKLLGQPYEYLTYDNQPIGLTDGISSEFAYITPVLNIMEIELNGQVGIGKKYGKFMDEDFFVLNMILTYSPSFKIGIEQRLIKQLSSAVYGDIIESFREETAVSFLISPYNQITGRWVSPYLKGDSRGQFYLSFLDFNIPF